MSERKYDDTEKGTPPPASDPTATSGTTGSYGGGKKPAEKPLTDEKPIGMPTSDRHEAETNPQG
jgi:hypothetical protein